MKFTHKHGRVIEVGAGENLTVIESRKHLVGSCSVHAFQLQYVLNGSAFHLGIYQKGMVLSARHFCGVSDFLARAACSDDEKLYLLRNKVIPDWAYDFAPDGALERSDIQRLEESIAADQAAKDIPARQESPVLQDVSGKDRKSPLEVAAGSPQAAESRSDEFEALTLDFVIRYATGLSGEMPRDARFYFSCGVSRDGDYSAEFRRGDFLVKILFAGESHLPIVFVDGKRTAVAGVVAFIDLMNMLAR